MEKWRDNYYSAQDIGFHFASSDRELVEKVSSIMKRNGHLSFSDSMGREHYLLDGRNGIPTLSRNIDKVTKRIVSKNKDDYGELRPYFPEAVDSIMKASGIPGKLKGYRYVRFILLRLIEDESLASPISKMIYPSICEIYHCTPLQIERDIRYAVSQSGFAMDKPSPKEFICMLMDHCNRLVREMKRTHPLVQQNPE